MSTRSHYGPLSALMLLSIPMNVDAQVFEVFGAGEESPAVGPSFQPNLTTESENILFAPEGSILEADAPNVCFDLSAPGRYSASDPSFPDGSCALGFMGDMDATLMHYNSLGSAGGRAMAVVVLERPVVGLAVARESLRITDSVVDPTGRANYSQDDFRGLESIDSLALGANHHVVSFDLTTTDRLDHTRVFTKAVTEAVNLISCVRTAETTNSASFRVTAVGPQSETATLFANFQNGGDCVVGGTPCAPFGENGERQLATCPLGRFTGDAAMATGAVTCTWAGEKPQLTLLGGTAPADLARCLDSEAPDDAGVGDGSVPPPDAGAGNPVQFSGGAACSAGANGTTAELSLFLFTLGLLRRGRRTGGRQRQRVG